MHRSGTTPRHRWLGSAVCALLLSSPLGLAAWADPAAGDPIADKRAEAERVARELDEQGERVSVLAERLNQARLEAEALEARVRTAESELAAAEREVAAVRARLRERAVDSYVGGVRLPMEQLLVSGSAHDVAVRETYVATVAGHEQSVADTLDEAQERRRAQRADLDATRRSARAVLAQVDDQRRAAAEAAAARRATLERVQGELGELVTAERARRAEEEAQRLRAELAARQERAARDEAAREEAARAAAAAAARDAAAAARDADAARRSTTTVAPVVGGVATTRPGPSPPGPSGPSDPPGAAAPAPGAGAAVAEARRQLGKPYEYGASGPDSFDCSGLTSWAWKAGGRYLPHSSSAQYSATRRVAVADIEAGDLVFYGTPIHHVGIYAGDGMMVEASETGTPVRMASIYRRDLVGVGRLG